jgi:hypothetical protein
MVEVVIHKPCRVCGERKGKVIGMDYPQSGFIALARYFMHPKLYYRLGVLAGDLCVDCADAIISAAGDGVKAYLDGVMTT